MKPEWEIAVEEREPLNAMVTHALSETPEEDTWKTIQSWAGPRRLLTKEKGTRLFGRNTYPTKEPEPHGYQLYITVEEPMEPTENITPGEVPGGLYAVLRSTSIEGMAQAWPALWKWLEESQYQFTGWEKGEHGWVNGLEEHLNPFDGLPPEEWLFNLMIPVKKKT